MLARLAQLQVGDTTLLGVVVSAFIAGAALTILAYAIQTH